METKQNPKPMLPMPPPPPPDVLWEEFNKKKNAPIIGPDRNLWPKIAYSLKGTGNNFKNIPFNKTDEMISKTNKTEKIVSKNNRDDNDIELGYVPTVKLGSSNLKREKIKYIEWLPLNLYN